MPSNTGYLCSVQLCLIAGIGSSKFPEEALQLLKVETCSDDLENVTAAPEFFALNRQCSPVLALR